MNPTISLTGEQPVTQLLVSTCQTCDGSGAKDDGCPTPDGGSCRYQVQCPDCDARGWVLDPDRLEAAAVAVFKSFVTAGDRKRIEAAVLAYMEPQT